ncbi:MAG: methyltransferase [Geminicoccaceae bacterium]
MSGLPLGKDSESSESTEDTLLDGRVRLRQPKLGYRVAMDTVLAAACVPADGDTHVLDAGAGTGGISLCVLARVPAARITAIERDDEHLAYLETNLAGSHAEIIAGDLFGPALRGRSFDHVVTNPPFFEAGAHRLPKTGSKRVAGHAAPGDGRGVADWIEACMKRTVSGGSLSIVHRAEAAGEILRALDQRFGDVLLVPVFTHHERLFAHRVLVRARKGSRAPLRLHRGLCLTEADGSESAAARAILRDGQSLDSLLKGGAC